MPLAAVLRLYLPSVAAADGLFAGYPVRRSLCHLSSTLAPVPRQGRPAAEGRVRLHRHIAQDKAARRETPKYALVTSATTTGAIRGRGQEIGYVTKKKRVVISVRRVVIRSPPPESGDAWRALLWLAHLI